MVSTQSCNNTHMQKLMQISQTVLHANANIGTQEESHMPPYAHVKQVKGIGLNTRRVYKHGAESATLTCTRTQTNTHTHTRTYWPRSSCKWGQRKCRPESARGQSQTPCRLSCCWPGCSGRRGLCGRSSCPTGTSCPRRCHEASRPAASSWSARRSAAETRPEV